MMFRTKQEVDRHAADLLRRVRDEKEKNSKGYQIAKLYHQIGEHEIAKRYLNAFLNVREAVPQAHKLMGQICESLKDYRKAISSYERCLHLNENQKDVILKVCELLNQIEVDSGTIRYWVERAESIFPTNEIIFNLKEKLVGAESEGNPSEMENLFKNELAKKPGNVRIHIKLLQLYINSRKVDVAIEYAISVDSLRIFDFSMEWYDYLVQFYACPIIARNIEEQTSSPNVYIHKMFVHCKQILLWLQYKDVSDASQALHVFDQLLLTAATMEHRQPEWGAFIKEMKGCFFFFGGTLLFKRALKGQLTWKEAENLASICYLVSENHQPVDKHSEWYLRGDGSKRLFLSHLHKLGCYRLSQGGYVLSEIVKKHSSNWVTDLRTRCATPASKERLYDLLFTFREMRNVRDMSFLLSDCGFSNMAATAVPSKTELAEYDAAAHLFNASDLNNIVWLCLHHFNSVKDESQPAYKFSLFDNLRYSSRNLSRGLHQGIESLCQLDMEVFLCCAVYCTSQQLQQVRPEPHQPHLLPKVLCRQFCTQEQADWWKLACKLGDKVDTENFTKMRLILMRGLDTIRLVGSHGMSATLITHLARTLQSRAAKMKKDVDNGHGSFNKLEELEERATFYWEAALPLLQRLQKNLVLKMPKERLFAEDADNRLDASQIKEMLSDAEYHLALCFMRRGEHEEAIKRFENLTNPWASYHAAQIYRKLALNEHNGKGREETISDNHSHYTVLLTKAKEALYVTLDRLKGNKSHQLNLVISQDIDDIECYLTRVDIDNVVDGDSSGESFCSANSVSSVNRSPEVSSYINDSNANRVSTPIESSNCIHEYQKEQKKTPATTKHHTPSHHTSSHHTPSHHHGSAEASHIRPSPERLDAQLRALQLSHSSILKPIVDQNKELTKLNVALQCDLRELREQHQKATNQLREVQELNRLFWAELSQYRMMSGFSQGPPAQVPAPPSSQVGTPQTGPQPLQNLTAAYMNSPYRPPSIPLTPQPPPWIASQYPAYQLPGSTPSASYRPSSPKNLQNPRQSGVPPYSKIAAEDSLNIDENEIDDDDDDDDDDHEEDPCHVDGEYYDEGNNSSPNNFHIPDSQLVQEWPFGHQTGLVGKSTVTYSVQNRPPMPRAGYFADVLRGQTLQYGYNPSQSPVGRMPAPGFFSGNKGQGLMFTPPSTQVTGTPLAQPPPLASALSGKSPVFPPNSLSPLPPMPPNAVVGPTFAKPIPSPATAETPPSFLQTMSGQTPFQLTMPPPSLGTGSPVDSFSPAQGNNPSGSGFTTPIKSTQRSSYDVSLSQTWPSDKLSTPPFVGTQQILSSPQLPGSQTVSFTAKKCIVNYDGTSHTATLRVLHSGDGNGVIVIASASNEKQLILQQAITANLDIQSTVFEIHQVSWYQPALSAKENMKSQSKCVVDFDKGEEATQFKSAVDAIRNKLPSTVSPGTTNKPDCTFPSSLLATTTITTTPVIGSISATPKVLQSPLTSTLSSNQPESTSILLKVLNQPSDDVKSTISSTPVLSTSVQETPKGVKLFQGLTFIDTPKVDFDLTKFNAQTAKETTASTGVAMSSAPNPFGNFSFLSSTATPAPDSVKLMPSSLQAVGTSASKNANSNEKMGFMETKPTFNLFSSDKALPIPGGKLFPSSSEGGKDDEVEEYEPNVDFKPVVPLPELVALKTGEEEEEKMFGDRARLFRFDKDISQWKERGIGELKLLRNKCTNRSRLLMRREQVLKICANHFLSSEMKLTPMPGSDRAWSWMAQDFAEEEIKIEKFAAKFKTAEIAEQFREAFLKGKDLVPVITESSGSIKGTEKQIPTTSAGSASLPLLSEMFKSQKGSWECDSCCVRNEENVLKCAACSALKPGVKPEDVQQSPKSNKTLINTDCVTQTGFKFDSALKTEDTGLNTGIGSNKFVFGATITTTTSTSVFNTVGSGFKFTPMATPTSTITSSSTGFVFRNETANVFGKTTTPKPDPLPPNNNVPLNELFKITPGDWECSTCLVRCNANEQQCSACMTPKPGASSTTKLVTATPKPDSLPSNSNVPLNELFKITPGEWECSTCMLRCNANEQQCSACMTPKPGASSTTFNSSKSEFSFPSSMMNNTFVFGVTPSANKSSSDKETGQKNIFGITPSTGNENKATNTFSFAPNSSSTSSLTSKTQPATLSSPAKFEFTFKSSAQTPGKGLLGPGPSSAALNPMSANSPSTESTFPFSLGQTRKTDEPKSPETGDDGYYVNKDGEDSHIYFEPVVPLPEKVDVKTGEEDEECLFEHRAKLYRFSGSEWKERGIGNIKILKNIQTKKLRIVMRREQVLKVCCNHYITTDLDLKPMHQGNGKVWLWYAMDSSDGGEPTHQQLSIRFKSAEIANEFKQAFDKAKMMAGAYAAEQSKPMDKSKDAKEIVKSPLSRQLFINSSEQDDVIFVSTTEATPEQVTKARQFFLPDHFYLYETKPSCSGCRGCDPEDFKKLNKENSPVPAKSILPKKDEKSQPKEEIKTFVESSGSSLFSSFSNPGASTMPFQSPPGGEFLFSTLAAQVDTMEKPAFQKDSSKPFTWHGAGQKLFGESIESNQDGDMGGDDDVVQNPDIHFEPIVPLPALVDHKSGEEDETPIFMERAKLFRFDQNQWKEKGIGSMKILKHKTDLRFRLLLRREQVLKLACNHILTPALKLRPLATSETSWCWTACDYTDSAEGQIEFFALKFKTIAIASQFQKCFLECQELLTKAETCEKPPKSDSNVNDLEQSIKQLNVEQDADEDEEDLEDEEEYEYDDEEEELEEYDEEEEEEEEDEEEYQSIFERKATLSYLENDNWVVAEEGDLFVLLDEAVNRMHIRMKADNHNLICNHIIARDTTLTQLLPDKQCGLWAAMDYSLHEPVKRTFKVKFQSPEDYLEFGKLIKKGRKMANKSENSEHAISHLVGVDIVADHHSTTTTTSTVIMHYYNYYKPSPDSQSG